MKTGIAPVARQDDEFPALLDAVRGHAAHINGPLFTTHAENLFGVFLSCLPDEIRQTYTCHCCRRFVEAYCGLVTIDENGHQTPALWPEDVPEPFARAVTAVRKAVGAAKVTGVFLTRDRTLGTPVTGYWSHLSVPTPASALSRSLLLTPSQAMAEKIQDREILLRGLAAYPLVAVEKIIPLLRAEALYRSEKVLGVAEWLLKLHESREATKRKDYRDNLVWRAVATAPPGWCHVGSTMIGTLLDDVAAGLDVPAISRRFAAKMHPLQYLRPQASPTVGNIERAEKVIADLGLTKSLERRYATLDDIQTVWRPVAPPPATEGAGVFAALRPKVHVEEPFASEPPPIGITWEKFARTVLATADAIEYRVPLVGPFLALATAVHPDEPPILQWDREDRRNPVSWYVYPGGSYSSQWGLRVGTWAAVTAVALFPHMWDAERTHPNHGPGAVFVLAGCVDSNTPSAGLFPEILRSDLHGIRATIEAHSKRTTLSGHESANACGVDIRTFDQAFRVTTSKSRLSYRIDRWD